MQHRESEFFFTWLNLSWKFWGSTFLSTFDLLNSIFRSILFYCFNSLLAVANSRGPLDVNKWTRVAVLQNFMDLDLHCVCLLVVAVWKKVLWLIKTHQLNFNPWVTRENVQLSGTWNWWNSLIGIILLLSGCVPLWLSCTHCMWKSKGLTTLGNLANVLWTKLWNVVCDVSPVWWMYWFSSAITKNGINTLPPQATFLGISVTLNWQSLVYNKLLIIK